MLGNEICRAEDLWLEEAIAVILSSHLLLGRGYSGAGIADTQESCLGGEMMLRRSAGWLLKHPVCYGKEFIASSGSHEGPAEEVKQECDMGSFLF